VTTTTIHCSVFAAPVCAHSSAATQPDYDTPMGTLLPRSHSITPPQTCPSPGGRQHMCAERKGCEAGGTTPSNHGPWKQLETWTESRPGVVQAADVPLHKQNASSVTQSTLVRWAFHPSRHPPCTDMTSIADGAGPSRCCVGVRAFAALQCRRPSEMMTCMYHTR
jgi:hypothetical protein